VTHPKFSKNY